MAARFVVNRAALDEITGGAVDGVIDLAGRMVAAIRARAPDAPPYGEGLVDAGGAIVWAGRKKVGQVRSDGGSAYVRKPPGVRLSDTKIVAVVGWGFPGSLLEFGTINMRAQPFFTPGVADVAPDAEVIVSEPMKRRLRGQRDPRGADINQRRAAKATVA